MIDWLIDWLIDWKLNKSLENKSLEINRKKLMLTVGKHKKWNMGWSVMGSQSIINIVKKCHKEASPGSFVVVTLKRFL